MLRSPVRPIDQMLCAASLAAIVLAGCSSGNDRAEPEPSPSTSSTPASIASDNSADAEESDADRSDADGTDDAKTTNIDSVGEDDEAGATESSPGPARRVPAQVSDETTHWVGHGAMSEAEIEITWSEVEGDEVVYQIFRFDSVGFDPDTAELDNPIHEGVDTRGWIDDAVEPGSFYTYVMRVIADNEVLERRWTDTLAVTDTTPPSDISGLIATVANGEVLLEWDVGADDVEFGSYGVFRTDLGAEPQYVGGGGDLAVTSFIDNDIPASGTIGYEVVAFDFHDNRSSPTAITVDLP